jgi:uncharacterized NAD-dependent epimerase/dehydratase family protein
MMQHPRDGNAIVYCQGGFATTNGKTAHGLVRRTDRYYVLSVVDSRYAGRDAGEVLDGKARGIPVYGDLHEAVRRADQAGRPATHFVIGLAPDGGRLSEESRRDVAEALKLGLNVDSGLHDMLSEDPLFSKLAALHGAAIRDIRKLPPRENMHFFSGKIEEVRSLKIAVLGTDSALGKRTTAWILHDAFREAGLSVELIGTGQTAWMQGARYSIIIDSLIVDFVTGEIEHALWRAWRDFQPDVILIEGQGSLLNPAYPGGMEILSAGRPDVIVVQHAPARKEYDGFPGYTLHPLTLQIRALELLSGRPVGAVTINHEGLQAEEIGDTCTRVSRESGLPTADVLVSGAGEIAARLVRHQPEVYRKYRRNREGGGKWGGGLEGLLAIDRLEVGPVKVERQRVTAPYSIVQNGAVDSIDFTYRFEEEVFEPGDFSSRNLASMMAAQIALNYGLFCRTILLRGSYDETDRHFLKYMLRNTAREIYVKKLLEHNPFLIRDFVPLQAERRSSYAQAELMFSDDDVSSGDWTVSRDRCAVLASGGKESLLSFALMDELGMETHPVFVNESGRHWYSALNSYRAFREMVPRTARVWTTSDRVFSWMLEHLPFIRHNFLDLRADDYPLRLWTVAVFLFGSLPILRKRGVGLLLVGDEYDTTRRGRLQGIPHYDGLFDQSRYFDRVMSAYFTCKGWKVEQLSVLRPLSELQRNQMSCHAATMDEGRARPCGRCEKCRRVVGMLSALGADPTRCGYTKEQVLSCLEELPRRSLHQESATATRVVHLLRQRGLIGGAERSSSSSEVESLRFNEEQAPLSVLPPELRVPLLKVYLQYARGSLQWTNGRWQEFDPIGT